MGVKVTLMIIEHEEIEDTPEGKDTTREEVENLQINKARSIQEEEDPLMVEDPLLWPVFVYCDVEVMFHLWYEYDAVVYDTNMLFLFLGYILACDSYFDNYI